MKDLKKLVKDIERDLVINIALSVRYKRIEKNEARDLAKEFMNSQPFKNKSELFKKLSEMSDKYKEIRKIYVKYALEYEEEKNNKILESMRYFMKKDEIENAIKVARDQFPGSFLPGGGE